MSFSLLVNHVVQGTIYKTVLFLLCHIYNGIFYTCIREVEIKGSFPNTHLLIFPIKLLGWFLLR